MTGLRIYLLALAALVVAELIIQLDSFAMKIVGGLLAGSALWAARHAGRLEEREKVRR